MRDRQTCVGCGKQSPETETNYTLISAQFGWRLTRYKSPDGALVVEWRCPSCWREYKRARVIKPGDSNPPPPPSPSSGEQLGALRARSPFPRPPTPMGSFRPRTPSTSDAERRSSNPAPTPADRRPSSPQRISPTPRPAAPSRPLPPRPSSPQTPQPSPSGLPSSPPPRPGRGSR